MMGLNIIPDDKSEAKPRMSEEQFRKLCQYRERRKKLKAIVKKSKKANRRK